MKIRLAVALVGLAIGSVLPTFAQQKDTVDPQIAQQIRALGVKYDEAFNKNDAAAVAALYKEDAVWRTPHGTFTGRQAIEKDYAKREFQQYLCNNHVLKIDQVDAVGNDVRALGTWTCTFQEGSLAIKESHVSGHLTWIIVRVGDTWQIRRCTYDESVAD
jgi:uncharacterized protein (TIGR02246 family)